MMDAAALRDFIRAQFTSTAFRLETLQQYDPTAPDYRRYINGEPGPNKQAWLDRLADERRQGLYRHRVRIVTAPVTDYTRYECEWGYAPNVAAGEDIRVLDGPAAAGSLAEHDWWLIDDTHLLLMQYDLDGMFGGAHPRPDLVPVAIKTRDQLWAQAEPFTNWWDRHPELHRTRRHVA